MMKMAFWAVLSAGFIACSAFGIGPVLKRMGGDWTSLPMLAGVVLGGAILALAVAFVVGFRPPLLPSDAAMVALLGGLIVAKVVVGVLTMSGVLVRG